jgi:ubiquinone/menaquinone biosynthesis C-methylase UbiE
MKFSTNQMDNFYDSLGKGIVKTSGIMNFIQHLLIAQKCINNENILEVCCGRSLILPLLQRYSKIDSYIGIDISEQNLKEAKKLITNYDISNYSFEYQFIQGDVTRLTAYIQDFFDVIIYSSSIEHMSKIDGISSINEIYKSLKKGGKLYLSTPCSENNIIQYKVHIYEWSYKEIKNSLFQNGFKIIEEIGLLPCDKIDFVEVYRNKFGINCEDWFLDLKSKIPEQFIASILSASVPEYSKEVLFICEKQ